MNTFLSYFGVLLVITWFFWLIEKDKQNTQQRQELKKEIKKHFR